MGTSQRKFLALMGLVLLSATAAAQKGDRDGEVQTPLPDDLIVPAAPALSAEEELATFVVPDGMRVELVACEPLVVDPVAMAFDDAGRLWVVEMRGYMPNVDGEGEDAPVGTIAVLTDTDGDGRMDERSVFMANLVLPRAIAIAQDGILTILPPDVLFCRDTDGDGMADERVVIDTGKGGIHSPEHAINGLLPTQDNWFHCANEGVRYGFREGKWVAQRTGGGGQWGVAKDDLGRFFFNTNSDPLRGDLISSHYAVRNPNLGRANGTNVRFAKDFEVWPARINPGVNRGYQPATLRDDFTLYRVTGTCAPLVYRGDVLADCRGDAFVAEPCGNLIMQYELIDEDGSLRAERSRPKREFLTSTDERFRPVNLHDGPDGALYIVDLYRGILQHRIFVTSFLRRQIIERGLDTPVGLGRIWRVVPDDFEAPKAPDMAAASWTELVGYLGHPNGWWRDTAQRLLVEEGQDDPDAHELLREMAVSGDAALGRMHALWTLDGIGGARESVLLRALGDKDARVLHAAVRVSETLMSTGNVKLCEQLAALARRGDRHLRWQVLLSLGEARTDVADDTLAALMLEDSSSGRERSAVLSGLGGRELTFLRRFLSADTGATAPGRAELLFALAKCISLERRSDRIEELLGRVAALEIEWQQEALLEGLLAGRGKGPKGKPGFIRLPSAPAAAAALAELSGEAAGPKAKVVLGALAWPGKAGLAEEDIVRPLTEAERSLFERGRVTYQSVCASCHQTSGHGDPGKAPPLRGSDWVFGDDRRLARILLHGLNGPLKRGRQTWNMDMPAYAEDDESIAAVLTYIRREWGHGADPVRAESVATERAAFTKRGGPWTVPELKKLD